MAKAEVTLKKGQKPKINIELMPTEGEEKDPEYLALLQSYLDRAEAYQQEAVAKLPISICSNDT